MKTIFRFFLISFAPIVAWTSLIGQSWNTNGNAPSSSCFIGTTNPMPLVMKTNGAARLTVNATGIVQISSLASADTAPLVVLPDGSLAKGMDPGNGGDCNTLIWDGDGNASSPNCFIGTTNAQPFRIYTNGMERMRVTADGNVVVNGFGAKAPFQVFDHLGVTFNRNDISATDVTRSIGFNLYQVGFSQYHYQLGPVAKMEFSSVDAMLNLSVAPSQASNAQVAFPAGLQIHASGRVGIGYHPDAIDQVAIGGTVKMLQSANPNNFVRIGHDGSNVFVQTGGNAATALILSSQSGGVGIEQVAQPSNYLRLGHNGNNAFIETGGNVASKLQVNMQSAKPAEFGGNVLVNSRLGVGTTNFWEGNREFRVSVNGHIRCKGAHIYPTWADYVFDPKYPLMPLNEVRTYISANGHLPGMPSASTVEAQGVDIGDIQAKTLAKVEELTLYLLEMKMENEKLRMELEGLRKEIVR
jgi:hypothetical protein